MLQISIYCLLYIINLKQTSTIMNASQPPAVPQEAAQLKLYVFGSCESDQYYHPKQEMQSKRPICLTDIEEFVFQDEENEEEGAQNKKIVIPNPLRTMNILKIACGALHTVISTVEGRVYTFGCNDEGALGREGVEKVPLQVKLDHPIDLISAGDNHSIFASSGAGKVYFAGNYKYMRGEKMAEPVRLPKLMDINDINNKKNNESKLTKVASGSNHTVVLIDGRVYVRGDPEAFTIGRKSMKRHRDIQKNSLTFEGVGLTSIVDVWCGGYHTIAKGKKGKGWAYYVWGLNRHGQLGLGNYDEQEKYRENTKLRNKNIVDVAAGTNFTVLLTEEGELLGCGQNDEGQLGLGEDYKFVDSEEGESKVLEAQIEEQLNIHEGQGKQQENEKKEQQQEGEHHQSKQEQEKDKEEQGLKEEKKPYSPEQQNIYIKSLRPINIQEQDIETKPKPTHITAGSQFVYAWNDKQLYSWGFAMNYVLLNGSEDNQFQPFKVKPKIINEHTIHQLSAGAQHVAYLSYPQASRPPKLQLSQSARRQSVDSRKKLTKRRRSPAPK